MTIEHFMRASKQAAIKVTPITIPTGALTRDSVSPILPNANGTGFDSVQTGTMTAMKFATNDYRMWYEGNGSGTPSRGVGYATATDGVTFTKSASNPIVVATQTWELVGNGDIAPKTIIYEQGPGKILNLDNSSPGVFKMWYHINLATSGQNNSIGYAESLDGITWTKYINNPILQPGTTGAWDATANGGVFEPTVYRMPDGSTRMYYFSSSPTSVFHMGIARSTDGGLTFTKDARNPIFTSPSTVSSFRPIRRHNYWISYYCPTTTTMSLVGSLDGINWQDIGVGTVLSGQAQSGSATEVGISGNMNIWDDNTFIRVNYEGFNGSYTGNTQGRTDANCGAHITDPQNEPYNPTLKLVQFAKTIVTSGTSITVTLPVAATANNRLVAAYYQQNQPNPTTPTGYTVLAAKANSNGSPIVPVVFCYGKVAAGGETAITIASGSTANQLECFFFEIAGLSTTLTIDGQSVSGPVATSTSGSPSLNTPANTAVEGHLVALGTDVNPNGFFQWDDGVSSFTKFEGTFMVVGLCLVNSAVKFAYNPVITWNNAAHYTACASGMQ